MKQRTKKEEDIAQASLEYLLIYGFGISLVVFSIVLAWQFGAFSQPPEETFGSVGFSQIVVEDSKAYGNFLNLSVKNNAPDPILVTRINASIEYKENCTYSEGPHLIDPGMSGVMTLTCTNFEEKYPPGKYYKANILIEYINLRTNNLHQSLGYIWGAVE